MAAFLLLLSAILFAGGLDAVQYPADVNLGLAVWGISLICLTGFLMIATDVIRELVDKTIERRLRKLGYGETPLEPAFPEGSISTSNRSVVTATKYTRYQKRT